MKKKLLYFIIFSMFLLVGCNEKESRVYDKYTYNFFGTFDTVVQTVMYAENQEKADEYNKYIEKRFNDFHKEFDKYNTYDNLNNLKTINDNAGIEPVKVSDGLFYLVQNSLDYSNKYSKKTDISFGAVLNVWSKYRDINEELDPSEEHKEEDLLPNLEELENANEFTGSEHIVLDENNKTVYIDNKDTQIDLGATAKGYAVEIICNEAKDLGLDSLLISAGGNVKAVGHPLDGVRGAWGVGVINPDMIYPEGDNPNIVDTFFVKDFSVVTSGDYQRFFHVGDKSYHHLIDPDTLYPGDYFKSVTIFHEDSGLADFLSTAVFLMPYEDGLKLVESLEGTECMWIDKESKIYVTEGLKDIMLSEGASGAK